MSRWVQGLNPEQAKAVVHTDGPLLILAGAGSGKTTVLVSRTGRLIEDRIVPANQICVLTFTNKAARELKSRVAARVGSIGRQLTAGTFHSFGLQFLRKHHKLVRLPSHFGIVDSTDVQAIVRDLLRGLVVAGKNQFDLEKLVQLINAKRVTGKLPQAGETDEYLSVAEVLAPQLTKKLQLLGVVDFEDLLLLPHQILREHEEIRVKWQQALPFIMVDEFQDTNSLQMSLLEQLWGSSQNIAVVGDDDQAIYGWRGAEVSHILQFPKVFKKCEVIRLERNYRSSASILNLANHVIGLNKERHGKVLKPEGLHGQGEAPELFVFEDEDQEAEWVVREIRNLITQGVRPDDIALLYRSNSQAGVFEAGLKQENIDYSVTGGTSFFDRKEIKDALGYLRLALGPSDLLLRRLINTPSRGVGEATLEACLEASEKHHLRLELLLPKAREYGIAERGATGIDQFLVDIELLRTRLFSETPGEEHLTMGERLMKFLTDIGYRAEVFAHAKDGQTGEKRWMGVEVLARVLDRKISADRSRRRIEIQKFVESMELKDFESDEDEQDKPQVKLMTLHASKGLEFEVVFLVGLEEGLLPHRTLGSDVSEERRLFYVGITRAERKLYLSRSKTRRRYGQNRPVSPSRFICELPETLLQEYQEGIRPLKSESERESLVANFLKNLGSQ